MFITFSIVHCIPLLAPCSDETHLCLNFYGFLAVLILCLTYSMYLFLIFMDPRIAVRIRRNNQQDATS